jgi:hypothetical protein
MKNSNELRKNADILENNIEFLLNEFISNNGSCEIKVDTHTIFHEFPDKEKILIGVKAKINIII